MKIHHLQIGRNVDRAAAGQALVEFALIISFVLVFAFIIIESGRLFQAWQTVQNAAREAGRYALTGQYDPSCLSANPACLDPRVHSIRQASLAAATGLVIDPNAGYNDLYYYFTEVMALDENGQLRQSYAGVAGQPVYVRVTYRMALITPVLSSLFPSVRLQGSVTVNNEDFDQYGLSPGGAGSPGVIVPPPAQEPLADLWLISESLPGEVTVGEVYDYQMTIHNIGAQTALDVQLTDWLPTGTAFISATVDCEDTAGVVTCDNLGDLAPNETLQFSIRVRAPNSIPDSPFDIVNEAEVSTSSPEAGIGTNFDQTITTVTSDGTDLVITSMMNTPAPVLAGENYTLSLTAKNEGPDPVATTNTVLTITFELFPVPADAPLSYTIFDSPPECSEAEETLAIICNLDSLAMGEEVSMSIAIGTNPGERGVINHVAVISADQSDETNQSSRIDVVPSEADLYVTAVSRPPKIMRGETVIYELNVVNLGPAIARDITVTNTLPVQGELIGVRGVGCDYLPPVVDGAFNCTIGMLSPLFGQNSVKIEVEVMVDEAETNIAPLINRVEVNAAIEFDPNSSNNNAQAITFIEEIDLAISKVPQINGSQCTTAGYDCAFTIEVWNWGPTPASGVTISDTLHHDFHFISATSTRGACQHSGASSDGTGGVVSCNIGSLAVNASATITLIVVPVLGGPQGDPAIEYVNAVTVTGRELEKITDNNRSETSIFVVKGAHFITVTPSCGDPGTSVTISGYNWQINRDIGLEWNSSQLAGVSKDDIDNSGDWRTFPPRIVPDDAGPPEGEDYIEHTIRAVQRRGQSGNLIQDTIAFTVPCPKPDLVIADLQLGSTGPIATNTPITFTAVISNTGSEAAVNQFYVSLYLNPPAPGSDATHIAATYRIPGTLVGVSFLEKGEAELVTFTAVVGLPTAGTHQIYAAVDSDPGPNGVINELNEKNNIIGPIAVVVTGGGPQDPGVITTTVKLEGFTYLPQTGSTWVKQPFTAVFAYNVDNVLVDHVYSDHAGYYSFATLPIYPGNNNGTSYTIIACSNVDGLDYATSLSLSIEPDEAGDYPVSVIQDVYLPLGSCWFPP